MQHFETGCPTGSRLDIEAWVRRVSSFSELADPAARPKPHPKHPKQKHFDTYLMSSSPKKKMAQRPSATKSDDSRLTRSMTRKGEGAGSKTVGFTVREKPASSAASGYDLISKAPSSSLRTMTSSNGTFATKSSSSKKKTGRSNAHIGDNPPIPLAAKDVMLIEDTLEHVLEMATKWRSTTTEAHWIFAVVGPLLSLIGKLSAFHGKAKNSNDNIDIIDITPIEISPTHLCPYSSTPFYPDLDKRIDYAIGLSPSPSTIEILQNAAYNTTTKSVNQTSTFCNFIPMFVNIEVKRRHVVKDPAIQLGSWIAAEFRKRLIEGWTDIEKNGSLGSPVFAIEIETDAWLLYVINAQLMQPKPRKASNVGKQEGEVNATEQDFKMCFFGPIRLGSTYSLDDTKRLVENLCDICQWGQTEFKDWWQETILGACEESN